MKKTLFCISLCLLGLSAVAHSRKPIPQATAQNSNQSALQLLPTKSRDFIAQYFPNETLTCVLINDDRMDADRYKAIFVTPIEIEFTTEGEWLKVDSKNNAVPTALIPSYVQDCITAQFPSQTVRKIKKENKIYGQYLEVELSNGLDLKFNKKGELIKVDD